MRAHHLSCMLCACALSACATSSPNSFEAAYDTHTARYADEMKAAVHEFEEGRITADALRARLRVAGEDLAAADAVTGQDEESVLATYSPKKAESASSAATAPALPQRPASTTDNSGSCFLISCPKGMPPQQSGTTP